LYLPGSRQEPAPHLLLLYSDSHLYQFVSARLETNMDTKKAGGVSPPAGNIRHMKLRGL
jgi:hypothetical protein